MGPLEFELTQRAILGTTIVSIACGVLGVLVILRGLAFISDALSHCVVPGAVVAYLTHSSLELWGGAAAVLSAWGIAALIRRRILSSDPAIAVVFTGTFALGLAIISGTRSYMNDLADILFGAVLAVSPTDLLVSGIVAAAVIGTVLVLYWPLVLVTFDPVAAQAQGIPVQRVDVIFYGLLALTVVSGMVAVGSVLVTGLLIVPATSARLVTRRVKTQMIVSACLGCAASWTGLYLSYYFPIASGGAIVLAAGSLFVLIVGFLWIRRLTVQGSSPPRRPNASFAPAAETS